MARTLPRSEAERTLDQLGQRIRLGIAVAVATLVITARQAGGVPEELLARGFLIAAAFFVAVLAHELPARLSIRAAGLAAGVIADLAATSLAVAVLSFDLPLAPIALLWPVFTAALVVPALYVLGVASLATIVLFTIVIAHDPGMGSLATAGGWGVLYLGTGFAYAEILRQFRRAQRTTESAFTHAASLAICRSPEEVGETLFAFADSLLGSDGAPAALLHDERGTGVHVPVAVRGIDAESRARTSGRRQRRRARLHPGRWDVDGVAPAVRAHQPGRIARGRPASLCSSAARAAANGGAASRPRQQLSPAARRGAAWARAGGLTGRGCAAALAGGAPR